ncbi:MAG: DUF2490 domain-containing protein [Candidatus Melainabacteria bacterium]|jgi:hypothetical protein|nr:DUF2490 domain-containing protein [Candidatus Melainabacteria bacterium]
MKVSFSRCLLCFSLLLLSTCLPQKASANAEHDFQLWTPVTLDEPIRGKLRGYFEVAPRIGYDASQISQLLVRPGLEYRYKPNLGFFAGYLWQTNYSNENSQVVHENRLWQQVLASKDIKRFTVIGRARLEQRFLGGVDGCSNRLRGLAKINMKIHKRLYVTAQDELFINLNSLDGGPQGGIDQNRWFFGVGLKMLKRNRVEVGYQLQYVNRTDKFDDLANHALVIQTFIGLRD